MKAIHITKQDLIKNMSDDQKHRLALGKGNANSDEVYICNYLEDKWEDLD